MKICVITLCFNEEVILPWFIRHYERFVDRIVFYDGGSSDRTAAIIAGCPIAEMRVLDTGGRLDDGANVQVKNTAYRDIDADWFIVVDCDEFLSHPDFRGFLAKCDALGLNVVRCEGWNMIGDGVPADGHLPERMPYGVRDDHTIRFFDKIALFRRDADVHFEPGAHECRVRNGRIAPGMPVKLLHYKWLSLEHVQRKVRTLRLSDNNVRHGWGFSAGVRSSDTWVEYYDRSRRERMRVDLAERERWNSRAGVYRAYLFPPLRQMRARYRNRHAAWLPFIYAARFVWTAGRLLLGRS